MKDNSATPQQLFQNYSNLSYKDLEGIAFIAAQIDRPDLIDYLLKRQKIHLLIVNRKGVNLLHAAMSQGAIDVIELIIKKQMNALWAQKSKRGLYPIEIAIKSNRKLIISRYYNTMIPYCFLPEFSLMNIRVINLLSSIPWADPLHYQLSVMYIINTICLGSLESDSSELRKKIELSWWFPRRDEFSQSEILNSHIYHFLGKCAGMGDYDGFLWIINSWNIKFDEWKENIADMVVMGGSGYTKDQYLMHFDKDLPPENSYSIHRGQLSNAIRYWDGNLETLQIIIQKKVDAKKEQSFGNDFAKLYLENIKQENIKPRLRILKKLAEFYPEYGVHILPSLHTVIIFNQLEVLKWMVQDLFINLTEPFHGSRDINMSDEEEDICAICYDSKTFPMTNICGHSFCEQCVNNYYQNRTTIEFCCPMCRRILDRPIMKNLCAVFHNRVFENHDWYQYDLDWTLGHVLLGFAASVNSILILDYLLKSYNLATLPRFKDNDDILHLATRKGALVTIYYLIQSEPLMFLRLLRNNEGKTPGHLVFEYTGKSILDLIYVFDKNHGFPPDWITIGMNSALKPVIDYCKTTISTDSFERIQKLAEIGTPLDGIVANIDLFLSASGDDPGFMLAMSLIELIKFNREDIIEYIFEKKDVIPNMLWGMLLRHLVDSEDANQFNSIIEKLQKLVKTLETEKNESSWYSLFLDGVSVSELENYVESNTLPDYHMTRLLLNQSLTLQRSDLIEWCLPKVEISGDPFFRIENFDNFKQIVDYYWQGKSLEYKEEWGRLVGGMVVQTIDTSFRKEKVTEHDKYSKRLSFLMEHPNYNTALEDRNLFYDLLIYSTVTPDLMVYTADLILQLGKEFCKTGGENYHLQIDNHGKSFLETILQFRESATVYLPLLRFLALEKKQMIQHLSANRMFGFKMGETEFSIEFEKIKKHQLDMIQCIHSK
jgi:hypothetical protein